MRKTLIVLTLLFSLFSSWQAFAGKDPIGWSISPGTGFPSQTTVGSSYAVSYTLTNNLPFAIPLTVSAAYTGGTFRLTTNCNTTLAVAGSCLVHISLQPIATGNHTAQVTLAYGKNRVPLPQLSSTATSAQTGDKINGHVTKPLPAVTYTTVTYPVEFSFVNNGTAAVTATSVNVTGFTALTNTCTTSLAPNSSCVVSGNFTPVATGQTTLGVTYVYSNGSVPLTTQTNVQGGGACHHIDGIAALPLPTATYQYADNVVKYTFTNHCDASTETLGTVSLTSNGTATLTKGTDTCSGTTLAANASCSVYVSVVPTATTASLSVKAEVPYDSNNYIAAVSTGEAVNAIPNQTTSHTILFVNQCDQDVWYSFQNGAGGTGPTRKSPDPTPSGQNSFADYQLDLQLVGTAPFTKVLTVNEYVNGAIYGRTLCAGGVCQTGNCPVISGTGTCQVSQGTVSPVTTFEEFMPSTAASDGVYDISLINGFNLPGQMRSLAPIASDNSFGCGQSAGAVIQPAGSSLGMCPWTFTPPSTGIDTAENYIWVSSGADDGCTSSSSCTGSDVCGMAYSSTSSPGNTPINRRCGTFQGYWTIADYIGYSSIGQWGSSNLYTLYSLGTALPVGPQGAYGNVNSLPATYTALYGCTLTDNGSLNTGYGYFQNVCGCYNWNQAGSVALTTQSTQCTASNTDWINTVFPRISWLKQACPTAYSFQYDDKSASFTCNVATQKTSYQITYCPAGKTGA